MKRLILVSTVVCLSVVGCGAGETGAVANTTDAYIASVEEWRVDRMARLKAPGGYLNQVGLFWLDNGIYSFGGSPENDIVFPGADDANIGDLEVSAESVTMMINDGVDVRYNGERVDLKHMRDDTTEEPVTVTYGSLAWSVINRQGKLGVRLRDYDHPVLQTFPEIPHFDVRSDWRVEGTLRRFDVPKIMNVETVIEGLGYNPESPGIVEFLLQGERYELEAYKSGDRLFFVFGDRTSGKETYAAGRFLYAAMPGDNGKTVLDFNLAYNPPCAFNDFSTCPVASPRNRLAVTVEAGEKFMSSLHQGSSSH